MSQNTQTSNKRIAKNTMYLYLRMFISLALSLVTGRVVLRTLGVDDYGINAVVGGVIGMFGVIQVCMIGATSRFITFELGRGDEKRLKDTFSTTLTIHIIIALVLFVILETVGLWLVNYKLVIPEGRMFAANCVYQFSIVSVMLGVTQTPYSSAIVAHEKMDIYAYFDILNTVLKLVIIYLLLIGNMDKLILYSILTFCVSTLMIVLNRIYCIRHFPETRYHFIWDKSLLKPIFAFSGWDILGNVAVMARGEGVTILINMFFGTALNAAAGIANTVTNAVGGFSSNIIMAVKPQIIKRYADGEYEAMIKLTHEGTVLCFILMTCLSIPLMSEIHFVLNLWLGIVPAYACVFTNLILLFGIIGCMGSIVMNIVHATGKIKKTSLTNGCIYIMVLPITYIAYKCGAPAWVPFAYNALGLFIGTMCNIYYMTTYVPHLSAIGYFKQTVLPCFALFIAVGIPVALLHYYMEEGWLRLLASILLTMVLTGGISYKFMIDKEQREKVLMKVKEKFINRR